MTDDLNKLTDQFTINTHKITQQGAFESAMFYDKFIMNWSGLGFLMSFLHKNHDLMVSFAATAFFGLLVFCLNKKLCNLLLTMMNPNQDQDGVEEKLVSLAFQQKVLQWVMMVSFVASYSGLIGQFA